MMADLLEFKDIRFKVCIECKKYLWQNKWVRFSSIGEVLKKITSKSMNRKINADIKPLVPGNIEFKPGINYDLEVEVSLSPKEQYYLPATIEMTTCPKCGKR